MSGMFSHAGGSPDNLLALPRHRLALVHHQKPVASGQGRSNRAPHPDPNYFTAKGLDNRAATSKPARSESGQGCRLACRLPTRPHIAAKKLVVTPSRLTTGSADGPRIYGEGFRDEHGADRAGALGVLVLPQNLTRWAVRTRSTPRTHHYAGRWSRPQDHDRHRAGNVNHFSASNACIVAPALDWRHRSPVARFPSAHVHQRQCQQTLNNRTTVAAN